MKEKEAAGEYDTTEAEEETENADKRLFAKIRIFLCIIKRKVIKKAVI